MYKVYGNIWIEGENGALIGIGRLRLLEQIGILGSITAAAKSMKMSYRQAWELIDSMNKHAKHPFVITAAGGTGGGGSTLTEEGRKMILEYKNLLNNFDKFKQEETDRLNF